MSTVCMRPASDEDDAKGCWIKSILWLEVWSEHGNDMAAPIANRNRIRFSSNVIAGEAERWYIHWLILWRLKVFFFFIYKHIMRITIAGHCLFHHFGFSWKKDCCPISLLMYVWVSKLLQTFAKSQVDFHCHEKRFAEMCVHYAKLRTVSTSAIRFAKALHSNNQWIELPNEEANRKHLLNQ